MVIVTYMGDTISYSKKRYDEILENFPGLYSDIAVHPQLSYLKSGIVRSYFDDQGKYKTIAFASWAGEDEYYILYSHFLKEKNGHSELDTMRKKLIQLYDNINDLHSMVNNGGEFYIHRRKKIPAFVEYSLSQHLSGANKYSKEYSIASQKDIFLKSLRQFVVDEAGVNKELYNKEQTNKRMRELMTRVDQIGSLITDYFYLKQAQSFIQTNYED